VKCEVVGFLRKLMMGGYYPWAPLSGAGYVDIDDVAAAHTLAMLTPHASGRCRACMRSLACAAAAVNPALAGALACMRSLARMRCSCGEALLQLVCRWPVLW
jgi:hypothetical protein